MKKTFLVILSSILALALSGCAGFQQAVTGYEASAAAAINATNDNVASVWAFQACQTPVATLIRHPELVPALRALCLPAGAAGSLATLFDATVLATQDIKANEALAALRAQMDASAQVKPSK